MNRKRLILAALVGVLILSLAYAFWATPRQEKAPPRAEGARTTAKKPAAGKVVQPPADRLHLGLLSQEPQPFSGTTRDIFRLQGGGAAPAASGTEALEAPAVVEAAPPPPPSPPPTPDEILREKTAGIKVLGSLDKGGARTVFLSFDGTVSVVKAGEHLGKNRDLVVKELTASELVVGAVDGPETVRIRLAEQDSPTVTTISSGAVPGAGGGAARPSGVAIPPRRGLLQRPTIQPPPQEPVEQEEPLNQNVTQEQLLKQTPGGDD